MSLALHPGYSRPHPTDTTPLRLPCRLHRDLHVLSQSGEELDQTRDREIAGAVAHQRGDVRLLDAEDCAGLRLGKQA
jgi:hypothetical protein